ncbi:hypothetical protein [Streptomyces sp. NBC_01304]|uniref:hypothetical protein n=1 Tax=Streptomyces sp. NBC_01304 TaxID=2903818 RepID=UPI002E116446|nr:hypothetical protein OG430_41050 [Streptomyces sp. NBC_01304]
MRCSTVPSSISPADDPCTGEATHMLLGSMRDGETGTREPFMDPVCRPCGESFARRPTLKARLVPLHVHMTESAFIEIIEGHRLVKDPDHEARCFDCGTTGSPTWFRFQTNGCSGRPEFITMLHQPRETFQDPLDVWAAKSARLWWDYAVDYLHMHIEDWRVVTDDAQHSAYFMFRDREYGLRHNLLGRRFGAVKLPNRGRPEPEILNPELDPYDQAVFYFHGRMTDSGAEPFATWTPGHTNITARELIILYTPEGAISEVLRVPGLWPWAETTGAICDAFGPISRVKLQTLINE